MGDEPDNRRRDSYARETRQNLLCPPTGCPPCGRLVHNVEYGISKRERRASDAGTKAQIAFIRNFVIWRASRKPNSKAHGHHPERTRRSLSRPRPLPPGAAIGDGAPG
jgi:hypothetical protein